MSDPRRKWLVSPPVLIGLVLLLTASIVAILLLPSVVIPGPSTKFSNQMRDLETARNALRGTILQGAAGVLLILGALATWRGLEVGRQQRLGDEFVRAIELLTKTTGPGEDPRPMLAAHIGAVHTLDRVMRSDSNAQAAIVAVLASYIRQLSPRPDVGDDLRDLPVIRRQLGSRRPSVWWALDTLIRRTPLPSDPVIDLSGADIRYCQIALDKLAPAYLQGSDLRGCTLAPGKQGIWADRTTLWPSNFDPRAAGVDILDPVDPEDTEREEY